MMILENIRLALFSLKANKMRALLTMLGIIIGIASVIAIMTVGNSLTGSFNSAMADLGATNITVALQPKELQPEITEEGLRFEENQQGRRMSEDDYITEDMLSALCEKYPNDIEAISASQALGSGKIIDGVKYSNVSVSGVSYGYFVTSTIDILAGDYFSQQAVDDAKMVALVTDKAIYNIFGEDTAPQSVIGKQIQVDVGDKFYNFTIAGVYKYEQSPYQLSMTSEKDRVTDMYIPLTATEKLLHSSRFQTVTVGINSGADPDRTAGKIENFLNQYYKHNDCYEVMAFSLSSMVDTMSGLLDKITVGISVIAGIALLVGGIGVMNIMLVSITERTREIGTRKALGAPNSSIRLQFIVESIVICVIGGIIGIILGIAMGAVAAKLLDTELIISAKSIVISLSFSMSIGVFFGYYPANKAALMDPIEALRYE